jgi:glycosyltransferase involved in cell wall biosynthesis
MDNELISICMPVYNAGIYFEAAINSALQQTYTNIEIVIVDDQSTDNTLEQAKHFAEKDNRIHVYKNEQNLGLVRNWEATINLAKGAWIKFLFQDDILDSTCVETLYSLCKKNNTEFGLCARDFIFDDNADKKFIAYFKNDIIKSENIFKTKDLFTPSETIEIIKHYPVTNVLGEPICTLFTKKIFLEVGGFNRQMKQMMDYEFILKIILHHNFSYTNKSLTQFRIHNKSTSSTNIAGKKKRKEDVIKQLINSDGDFILLLQEYINDPAFVALKNYWGVKNLNLYIERLYIKNCKHHSSSVTKAAFTNIILDKKIFSTKYNLFRYFKNKRKFKKVFKIPN